jgi:hypothetical protein
MELILLTCLMLLVGVSLVLGQDLLSVPVVAAKNLPFLWASFLCILTMLQTLDTLMAQLLARTLTP